jgi:hypothetical protein
MAASIKRRYEAEAHDNNHNIMMIVLLLPVTMKLNENCVDHLMC